ncbi:MAG: DotG/IcmE/VirB10 family protein [Acetobacteraceae bacterium]
MSDAARLGKPSSGLPKRNRKTFFGGAGRAGPRRLVVVVGMMAVLAGFIMLVATSGRRASPLSSDARMQAVDPLPGGLRSTPEQNALAHQAETHGAAQAIAAGVSYTPPIAPSVPVIGAAPSPQPAAPHPASPPRPRFVTRPPPQVMRVLAPAPHPRAVSAADPPPVRVVPVADPQPASMSPTEVGNIFEAYGVRPPQTEVVLPPANRGEGSGAGGDGGAGLVTPVSAGRPLTASAPALVAPAERVLIPAGRGVYAHPVLALSSDQASPVVLQADSGPIAGDRMIGSFDRQGDRLVIHIGTIVHDGQSIGCNGVVIAPDTMEAAVASGVDEHYLARFILPAAAAFVEGLGQALATTSNTVSVLSPFGGATAATHLNLDQQLGVAAGVAAGQVANTLNQAAPKGPTVTLAANVGVGVMFLSAVKVPER